MSFEHHVHDLSHGVLSVNKIKRSLDKVVKFGQIQCIIIIAPVMNL